MTSETVNRIGVKVVVDRSISAITTDSVQSVKRQVTSPDHRWEIDSPCAGKRSLDVDQGVAALMQAVATVYLGLSLSLSLPVTT